MVLQAVRQEAPTQQEAHTQIALRSLERRNTPPGVSAMSQGASPMTRTMLHETALRYTDARRLEQARLIRYWNRAVARQILATTTATIRAEGIVGGRRIA